MSDDLSADSAPQAVTGKLVVGEIFYEEPHPDQRGPPVWRTFIGCADPGLASSASEYATSSRCPPTKACTAPAELMATHGISDLIAVQPKLDFRWVWCRRSG